MTQSTIDTQGASEQPQGGNKPLGKQVATYSAEVVATRRRLTGEISYFRFLNGGGMAFADHKGETVRQYLKALTVLQELQYFEKLAGLPLTSLDIIGDCRYLTEGNDLAKSDLEPK